MAHNVMDWMDRAGSVVVFGLVALPLAIIAVLGLIL